MRVYDLELMMLGKMSFEGNLCQIKHAYRVDSSERTPISYTISNGPFTLEELINEYANKTRRDFIS